MDGGNEACITSSYLACREFEHGHTCIVHARCLVSSGDSGAVKVHLSVDQIVVTGDVWRRTWWSTLNGIFDSGQIRNVVEVRKHHRSEIYIVVPVFGAINNDWPNNAVRILGRIMSMIPCRSVKFGFERVCKTLSGSNRALCKARNAVHPLAVVLQETVPMNRSAFGRKGNIVVESHLNRATPIGFDCWPGKRSVHQYHLLLVPIGSQSPARYVESVVPSDSCVWRIPIRIRVRYSIRTPWVAAG